MIEVLELVDENVEECDDCDKFVLEVEFDEGFEGESEEGEFVIDVEFS